MDSGSSMVSAGLEANMIGIEFYLAPSWKNSKTAGASESPVFGPVNSSPAGRVVNSRRVLDVPENPGTGSTDSFSADTHLWEHQGPDVSGLPGLEHTSSSLESIFLEARKELDEPPDRHGTGHIYACLAGMFVMLHKEVEAPDKPGIRGRGLHSVDISALLTRGRGNVVTERLQLPGHSSVDRRLLVNCLNRRFRKNPRHWLNKGSPGGANIASFVASHIESYPVALIHAPAHWSAGEKCMISSVQRCITGGYLNALI